MAQYFIRRNDRVNGPFSSGQIKSGVESKKLKATDFVAASEAGPWKPLSDYFRKKEAAQIHPMGKRMEAAEIQPTVEPEEPAFILPPAAPRPVAAAPSAPAPSAEHGTLNFKRKLTYKGAAVKIKVSVDGKLKAKLAVNQSAQVEVSPGQHEIEIKCAFGLHGGKTTVSVTPGSSFYYQVKTTALGCNLKQLAEPDDSTGKSLGEIVDGVGAIADLFLD